MNHMNKVALMQNDFRNGARTVFLVGALLALLAVLGLMLAGGVGLAAGLAFGVGLLVVTPRVSPRLLLRMLRARPLAVVEAPQLYELVYGLANRAGLPQTPRLYLLPGRGFNALTLGRHGQAVIGLNTNIVRALTREELAGVLAHEISHIRHDDLRVLAFANTVRTVASFLSFAGVLLVALALPLVIAGAVQVPLPGFLMLIFAPTVAGLLMMALSRTREFAADLGAARLTGDPLSLARALQKIEYHNMGLLGWMVPAIFRQPALLRSHPPTKERVRRLLALRGMQPEPRPNVTLRYTL